jgi:hypothetical protein
LPACRFSPEGAVRCGPSGTDASPAAIPDHLRSTARIADERRGAVYFVGSIIFAVLAVVLVVAFVRKWRQSND